MNQAMNLSLHQALFAYNCSREHVSERTERTNLAGSEKPSQSSGQACLTASPDVESLFAGYITARVDKRRATNGTGVGIQPYATNYSRFYGWIA